MELLTELEPYQPTPLDVRLAMAKALIAAEFDGTYEEFGAMLLAISETVLTGVVPDKPTPPSL